MMQYTHITANNVIVLSVWISVGTSNRLKETCVHRTTSISHRFCEHFTKHNGIVVKRYWRFTRNTDLSSSKVITQFKHHLKEKEKYSRLKIFEIFSHTKSVCRKDISISRSDSHIFYNVARPRQTKIYIGIIPELVSFCWTFEIDPRTS